MTISPLRLTAVLAAVLVVGGFFYLWWTQGDLPYYVAQIQADLPPQKGEPPFEFERPVTGTFVSQSTGALTIEVGGAATTYPLATNVLVFEGVGDAAASTTLAALRTNMLLLLIRASSTSTSIGRIYILRTL